MSIVKVGNVAFSADLYKSSAQVGQSIEIVTVDGTYSVDLGSEQAAEVVHAALIDEINAYYEQKDNISSVLKTAGDYFENAKSLVKKEFPLVLESLSELFSTKKTESDSEQFEERIISDVLLDSKVNLKEYFSTKMSEFREFDERAESLEKLLLATYSTEQVDAMFDERVDVMVDFALKHKDYTVQQVLNHFLK